MSTGIHVEVQGSVGVVQMDRPDVLNAIDREMLGALNDALAELGTETSIHATVLIGRNSNFTSGENLQRASNMSASEFAELVHHFQAVTRNLRRMQQPVIAAIDGYALGGGLEIAAACDLRIASDRATFGCPEVTIGQVISNGSSFLFPRLVGEGRARDIILTGEPFGALRALEIGLVNRVVPTENLMKEAMNIAERIASLAPLAIRTSKALLNAASDEHVERALEAETRALTELIETRDASEGLKAFLDKRPPRFRGE